MKGLSILLFLSHFCLSQAQVRTSSSNEFNCDNAYLYYLQGEKSNLKDTLYPEKVFKLNNIQPGIYRIEFCQSENIDVVIDSENEVIKIPGKNANYNLEIISSESNKLFYSFMTLNKDYKTKTELLHLILANYPKDDNYYKTTRQKLNELQSEYNSFVNNTSQKKPQSFIARYIKTSQLPVVDFSIPPEQTLTYLKSHALDYVDFNDDGLINSDAFTNKTIEYLTYYRNPQLPKELLEKEFMAAVDTILNKSMVNSTVYQHIVEYLIDGFKKFGFDTVLDYIVENYVIKDDLCLDVKTEGMIKKRIDQAKYLHVGNVVPDISLPDSTGKMINLKDIITEKILIIFYASWCPHCQTLLPQIRDLYNKQKEKDYEVLAISLDTSRTDWLNFVRNNSLNWINVCDLKGWDGEASTDYFLYATPSIFLIDKERKIFEKPTTYVGLLPHIE